MKRFFYQGGAYGDETWQSACEPSADEWASWECGELLLVKFEGGQFFAPCGVGEWEIVKEVVP